VSAERRRFWEQLREHVEVQAAEKFGKKWTELETLRVIAATPDETYEALAAELGRSPGAVRYRRMAMVHLLRHEHGAPERVGAFLDDPKTYHKQADYAQVHRVLEEYGYYARPIREQFALAQPLLQPSSSWRGDGTSAALNAATERNEVRRLLRELRAKNGTGGNPGERDA
jgi:hypothetical protein